MMVSLFIAVAMTLVSIGGFFVVRWFSNEVHVAIGFLVAIPWIGWVVTTAVMWLPVMQELK